MKKRKEIIDKTRNNIFAAAFDEMKRREGGRLTQVELARRMGVNKDTITNILKGYTEVTEDAITSLQTASGCIFNLQWLRGESRIMLAADVTGEHEKGDTTEKDRRIAELERELEDKKEIIRLLHEQIDDKVARIADLTKHRDDLRMLLTQHVAKDVLDRYPFSSAAAEGEGVRTPVNTGE